MITILISACLVNQPVRYNAKARPVQSPLISRWQNEGRLRPVCPECAAGLPTPRAPAEIQGGSGTDVLTGSARVFDNTGKDLSALFVQGAEKALAIAQQHNAKIAILCERSPSCGSGQIYTGEFNGQLHTGVGVTTALLQAHQIQVFNQEQLNDAQALLEQLEYEQQYKPTQERDDEENKK